MVAMSKHGIVQTLVNAGRNAKADFVIMGTTGASGLKEVFLGSVAAEVLENATAPVLAVPLRAHFDGRINTIAFATEFTDADGAGLKSTMSFAKMLDAKVLCVHVDTTGTGAYKARMKSFVENFDVAENIEWEVVVNNSVEEGLVDFVDNNDVDILAMYIKKRNFIEELFTYSLTKKMANHLTIPVFGLHK